jgi:hypothetical protein
VSLLKNLFGKKEEPIKSYADFWNWFKQNEKHFFNVVKQHENIEKEFFNKLTPKLHAINTGYLFLTGMCDTDTVELIVTVDGTIKNIVFAEELVNAAPVLPGWKFTALKPAMDMNIEMAGYNFTNENLSFYSNEDSQYPDIIDLTIVHSEFTESNKSAITQGTYIFLDNYLGELEFATTIDNLKVIGKKDAQQELIPIEKLKAFLTWRQKEFIEKYDDVKHSTENNEHTILKAQLENGNQLIATINTDLLKWTGKVSHPWILNIKIKFNGENNLGMPDNTTYELLEKIENEIEAQLKDYEGFLNIGRQTAENVREIYFACKDFRKPSKVLHEIKLQYLQKIEMDFQIYSDKYWQSFNRFTKN